MSKERCPITVVDEEFIRTLMIDAIAREVERYPAGLAAGFSVAWQSEDRQSFRRLFHCTFGMSEARSVPISLERFGEGHAVNSLIQVMTFAAIADANGWLSVPLEVFLKPMPEVLHCNYAQIRLSPRNGTLFVTIMSNERDDDTNRVILFDDIVKRMLSHERYCNCEVIDSYRQND